MQVRWLWRRAGAWHGRRFWEFLFGDREKTSATTQLLESLRLLKMRKFFPVPMLEHWRTKCLITVHPTKNKHLTRNISKYLPFWHICKSAFVGGQGQLESLLSSLKTWACVVGFNCAVIVFIPFFILYNKFPPGALLRDHRFSPFSPSVN